jgi:aryl-alcohol dehydrogenase-like predicted oxidoreductase
MSEQGCSRRDFLRLGAAAGVGLAATHALAADAPAAAKPLCFNENMEYRRLGKTGMMVSAVCMGGHWKRIGSITGSGWDRTGGDLTEFDKNRYEVVSRAMDVGINYIDACSSGEILTYAKALKGRREKMHLGFSWYERELRFPEWCNAEKLVQGFDDGLKQAGLDYVDVWRVTCQMVPGNKESDIEAVCDAFDKIHAQGKALHLGISSHDRPWLKKIIERFPKIEVILTPFTAASNVKPADSLFDAVKAQDVGVFGIKPFSSGSLFVEGAGAGGKISAKDDELARLALRHILSTGAVTAPIPGLISLHQVDNVAQAVKEHRELDAKETAMLNDAAAHMLAELPSDYHWLRDHTWV